MSAIDILESLQRKLQAANSPIVARHTVAGIFTTLRKPGISADSRAAAISLCLTRPYRVIVQEAADQLLSLTLTGGLPAAEAEEFLLQAITSAGPAVVAPLAEALCRLVVSPAADPRVGSSSAAVSSTPQTALRMGRWTSHPLVAALLSCPAAATQLLSSAMGALGAAAAAAAAAAEAASGGPPAAARGGTGTRSTHPAGAAAADAILELTWASLEPFFSFVLLQRHPSSSADRGAAGGGTVGVATAAATAGPSLASSLTSAALSTWLHGRLVRLACGGVPYPALRRRLLDFLVAHLALGPRGAEVDRMHAVQSVTDILDVLESVLYDVEEETDEQRLSGGGGGEAAAARATAAAAAEPLANALLQLGFEILMAGSGGSGGGGGGGAQEVVAALLRLQSLVPGALQGGTAALSLLTLNAHGKELHGLHLLLHKALQYQSELWGPQRQRQQQQQQQQHYHHHHHHWGQGPEAADAALSLQPLLAAVAFGTSMPASAAAGGSAVPAAAWPSHLAAALQRVMDDDGGGSAAVASRILGRAHGDLCLHRQCRLLLLSMWAGPETKPETTATTGGGGGVGGGVGGPGAPCDLLRWLRSLELALRQRRRAAATAKAASEQLPFAIKISDVVSQAALGAADAHPAVTCVIAALLAHPDPRVRAAAATAARQLVQLLPAAALPLLPLVMYQLRRGGGGGGGGGVDGSTAQVALLQLLPVMAADPALVPYAMRVLQPMLQPNSPEVLRCLALKLICDTWLISGRGWPQVEAALNGLAAPGSRDPPPALRITRASLLRAVCDKDPGRGLELVSALQQAIRDPDCPAAAALGLEALAVLVEEDVLDFYTAYRVVHRWHPGLPSQPVLASRWVALLAHGSLDAEAYPDKATAILDVLWSAARHSDAEVRAAALLAISRYPLDLLEKLQILRPLSQYTAPLLSETDPRVSEAARGLAAVALRFEHINRRRLLLTQPASDVVQQPGTADGGGPDGGASSAAAGGGTPRGGGKGAAFAAAATAREARALRGRLMGRIPKMLLAGVAGGAGAGRGLGGGGAAAAAMGSFNPGAALFCYSRPPPPPLPPGASAAATAAAAKRAAAEARDAYSARLRDALRRLAWRGHWHTRLAVEAWATFIRRWMYDTGVTATALVNEWDGTSSTAGVAGPGGGGAAAAAGAGASVAAAPAAVLEGVGLAVGALCVAADGLPEADVSALTVRLLQQAQSGRSSGISRSSLVGAALAASRLHPTDWAARQQVLGELRAQLLAGSTAVVRSAAATALAVLAGSLAADPAIYIRSGIGDGGSGSGSGSGGGHSRELLAVAEAVSCLVATLGALCPQLAAPLAALAAAGMPPDWPPQEESYGRAPRPLKDELDEQEVLPGTAVALVSLLCDVNRAHGLPAAALPDLLAALVQVAAGGGGAAAAPAGLADRAAAATTVAALEAAAALAPEVLRYQQLQTGELRAMLATTRALCSASGAHGEGGGGTDGAADGRVRGAAAYCLGCVAVAALRQGALSPELVSELRLGSPATATTAAAAAAGTRSGGSEDAGEAALMALVSELAAQAGGPPDVAASKGQHTAAARMGAVAGLAALLLPPPASLVDALAPIPPGSISKGLLAQPECLAPAKAAVRALERLATEDADPWVTAAAAFHLAAVCAAVEAAEEGGDEGVGPSDGGASAGVAGGAGGAADGRAGGTSAAGGGGAAVVVGGGSGAGGAKPLSLYPPDGAVRPLVSALMDRVRLSALPPPALADTLLALAAAPALPAADWPTACRALLARAAAVATPASTAAGAAAAAAEGLRLQAATLLLALAHGSVPSLGLGILLEELVAPARFAALPPAMQGLLLARLPALLRSLAAKRAAAVVQGLPGLLAAAAVASPSAASHAVGEDPSVEGPDFPWSCPAGLDDPALPLLWLRRVRQGLGGGGAAGGGGGNRGGSAGSSAASWLPSHCWLGLLGVCRGWQAKDAALTHREVTQAAHSAIAALAAQLPPLPPLQPGEAAQLLAWAGGPLSGAAAAVGAGGGGSASASGAGADGIADDWASYGPLGRPLAADGRGYDYGGGGGSAAGAARGAITLWSLAACCLRCLRPDFLTAQVLTEAAAPPPQQPQLEGALPAGRALAALQLRCVLVAVGHVSYRELMPVRTAAAASAAAVLEPVNQAASGDPLLGLLSLALAGTPQAFQVQVLLQTLDAARAASQPGPPLELAAALVAACLAHAPGSPANTAPEICVALASRRAALECLPYTLPRLLSRPPWSSSCEAVAQALLVVAREALSRQAAAAGEVAGEAAAPQAVWLTAVKGEAVVSGQRRGAAASGEALGVVLACLWALRDSLPSFTYDQLHAALSWRTLARVIGAVEA